MVVEALEAVVARLVGVVFDLPARVRLDHAVQEALDADDLEVLAAVARAVGRDACDLGLGVIWVVGAHEVGEGAQPQLPLLLEGDVGLGRVLVEELRAGVRHGREALGQGHVLPGQKVVLGVLEAGGELGHDLHHGPLADVAVGLAVLVHVDLVVAHLLGVGRVYPRPLERTRVEQHRVAAARVHDERLVGADPVQVGLVDGVMDVLRPARGDVDLAPGVRRDELLDDLAVPVEVAAAHLGEVRLADGAVARQVGMGVGLEEARVDEVVAVVEHLGALAGKLPGRRLVADVGERAVLDERGPGIGPPLVHGDDVAEDHRLLHGAHAPSHDAQGHSLANGNCTK